VRWTEDVNDLGGVVAVTSDDAGRLTTGALSLVRLALRYWSDAASTYKGT
jgi:hypothetical protein